MEDHVYFLNWTDSRLTFDCAIDETPCLLCQQPVKIVRGFYVQIGDYKQGTDNGGFIVKPTEHPDPSRIFAICRDCYRKHKAELDPFVISQDKERY